MLRRDDDSWREGLDFETRSETRRGEPARLTVPGLTLLYHADNRRVGERTPLPELASGQAVAVSRLTPVFAQPGETERRPLADPHLSRRPLELRPAPDGGVRLVCEGTPIQVLAGGEPVVKERTFPAADLDSGVILVLAQRVVLLLHRFQPVYERLPDYGIVGASDPVVELRRQIRQVADLGLPVLLRGETGTGKELLARALHQASARRARPYLAINMAAVPASLAAAELFGATRGAFTGADRKREGYFVRADSGTLFLDEIGEIPAEVQPLLLRALETGEIQPVGGEETLRVDVRILAATDSNLAQEIAAGRFRAPLYHRLNGYEIRVPALRERRDDIGRLFLHFLRQELRATGEEYRLAEPGADGEPFLSADLVAQLAASPWPGNVRQLRNAARHLAVDSRGAPAARVGPQLARLLAADWDEPAPAAAAPPAAWQRPRVYRSPSEVSDAELVAALRAHRWDPGATARYLGVSRPALYLLIDACPATRKAADLERPELETALARCGGRLPEMVDLLEVSEEGLKRRLKQLGL